MQDRAAGDTFERGPFAHPVDRQPAATLAAFRRANALVRQRSPVTAPHQASTLDDHRPLPAEWRQAAAPVVGVGTLRRLSRIDPGDELVVSVYLNLLGYAGRQASADDVFDSLCRRGPRLPPTDHERVRDFLRSIPALARGTRALAIFSIAPAAVFEVVALPCSVQTGAKVDSAPWLLPLAAAAIAPATGDGPTRRRAATDLAAIDSTV
jgi:hypothetical protein